MWASTVFQRRRAARLIRVTSSAFRAHRENNVWLQDGSPPPPDTELWLQKAAPSPPNRELWLVEGIPSPPSEEEQGGMDWCTDCGGRVGPLRKMQQADRGMDRSSARELDPDTDITDSPSRLRRHRVRNVSCLIWSLIVLFEGWSGLIGFFLTVWVHTDIVIFTLSVS
jgi:hypothetical protein